MAQNPFDQFDTSAPAGGTILRKPVDPFAAGRDARDQARLDITTRNSERANTIAEQKLNADLYEKGLRIGANGQPEPIPGWTPPLTAASAPKLTAKERADALQAYNDAFALDRIVANLRQKNAMGPGATKGVAGLKDFFPTEDNRSFDKAAQRARGYVKRSLGFTGGEGNTLGESTMLYDPYLPNTSDWDGSIVEKIGALEQLAEDARTKSVAILGGVPDANGRVTPAQEGAGLNASGAGQRALATGDTRTEDDPETAALINRMVRQGATADQINAALPPGAAPVDPGSVSAAQQHLRKNPDYKGSYGSATRTLPIDNPRLNEFVQSPVGTAVTNFANMGGFGIPQLLAGDKAFQGINEKNPGSAMLGQIGGALGGSALVGALGRNTLGRAAPSLLGGGSKAAFGRGVATDATYGGAFGGVTEGDPLTGAALAGLGSAGGQALGSAIGRAAMPVAAPAASRLNDAGITLSLGQILRDRGGVAGRMVSGVEDRLAGLPFIGDMIQGVRTRGVEDFNIRDLNNAVAPIGGAVSEAGQGGFAAADDAVSAAYDKALGPMRLASDVTFDQAVSNAPPYFQDEIIRPNMGSGGSMTGEQLQTIKRLLDAEAANSARVPGGMATTRQAGDLKGALFDMADRQAPDLMAGYRSADEAFANLVPIRTATANAGNNAGIYTPAQKGIALRSTDRSAGKRATARGDRPGQDLQQDAQALLPSRVPDSGTVGRAAVAGLPALAAGGAGTGYIDPSTAAAISLPALLYTKAGQKLVQNILLKDRPDAVKKLGSKVRKHKGLFGSATAAPLLAE